MMESSASIVALGFNDEKVKSLKFFEQVCGALNMKLLN
jgi:hypothetical protein